MPSASFSLPVTWREPMYCKNRLWAGNIPCRVFLRAKRKHATLVETLLGVPDILRVASRTRYRNDRIQCERQSFPGHGCRTHGHDSTRAQSSSPPTGRTVKAKSTCRSREYPLRGQRTTPTPGTRSELRTGIMSRRCSHNEGWVGLERRRNNTRSAVRNGAQLCSEGRAQHHTDDEWRATVCRGSRGAK